MANPETPAQGPGGNPEEALDKLFQKLDNIARTAWKPMISEGDGEVTDSKFSGKPLLKKNESWPLCPNCSKPMQLFVQLNTSQLPSGSGVKGSGFIQMFYCTSYEPFCEVNCEAYLPFSKSSLLRFITQEESTGDYEMPEIENYFSARKIEGWDDMKDYPNCEEMRDTGFDLEDEEEDLIYSNHIAPHAGDKLGGWPHWIQAVEYPSCPECGEQMDLIFQLDSEDNLPYMWGDCGVGHITQCSTHHNKVAFGWACC